MILILRYKHLIWLYIPPPMNEVNAHYHSLIGNNISFLIQPFTLVLQATNPGVRSRERKTKAGPHWALAVIRQLYSPFKTGWWVYGRVQPQLLEELTSKPALFHGCKTSRYQFVFATKPSRLYCLLAVVHKLQYITWSSAVTCNTDSDFSHNL